MAKKQKTLTDKQALILGMLVAKQDMYGLEMIEESSGLLKRGSIYVLLNRLEDDGFISSKLKDAREGQQGPPRRIYRITGSGERSLRAKQLAASQMSSVLDKLANGTEGLA